MTEEEMRLFAAAQIAAGYLPPQTNARGDGWLYERDHDRFVGWQIGRLQERERFAALRTVAEQVLRDMKAQGVLLEWQTLLDEALKA